MAAVQKRSRITVLLDTEEFERFDRYCEAQGFKKSTLIARLIREHLNSKEGLEGSSRIETSKDAFYES